MSVTVYTTPRCRPCTATKVTLKRHGVAFTEEPAADHLDDLAGWGHTSAPVVVVVRDEGGEVVDHWSGFDIVRCQALAADNG